MVIRSYDVCFCLFSDIYKLNNMISSFQELLDNIYNPLFEVTIDPRTHPQLHMFLQYVSWVYIFTPATVELLFYQRLSNYKVFRLTLLFKKISIAL